MSWFSNVSVSPITGTGNSTWGVAQTTVSCDVYKDTKLTVTPSVTTTAYYTPPEKGFQNTYGITASYNFLGGK